MTSAGIFINGIMVYLTSSGAATSASDPLFVPPLEPDATDGVDFEKERAN